MQEILEDVLCFEDSPWLKETPIWIAELSNGQTVFQWDDQPGSTERSTWIRLRNYCSKNNIRIRELYLRYWDHLVHIKRGARGYFYASGAGAWVNSGVTKRHFVIGILEGDEIKKFTYASPELCCIDSKVVPFDPDSINFWWGTDE